MREAKEETGLAIKIIEKIGVNVDHAHRFEGDMLLAEVVSGEAKNLDERHHSRLEWFSLDDLPQPLGSTTVKGLQILSQKKPIRWM